MMNFQMKKPSAVLKHVSSIAEKKETEENTSSKLLLCKLSSPNKQNIKSG